MTLAEPTRTRRRGEEALLAALAAGHSYTEAGKIAGLSLSTVKRRMQDPLFRLELDDLKRQVVKQTAASLADASTAAVATLKGLLLSSEEWVQLRAATALIDISMRYRESLELSERVAQLEELAQESARQREAYLR